MKQKSLTAVFAFLFTFSFCMASCSKDDETIPKLNNNENNPSTSKMKITIGTAVFTATLFDNPSATAFKALLPITINMTELNNNEKYYDLPTHFQQMRLLAEVLKQAI